MLLRFAAALFFVAISPAAIFAADKAPASNKPQVQAMVLYGAAGEKPPGTDVDLWISKAIASYGSPTARAQTGWIAITGASKRLHSGNGFFIDGKVTEKEGAHHVEIEGCSGFSLDQNATLKPGERRIVNLTGAPGPGNIFIALVAPVSKLANKRAKAMKANRRRFSLKLQYHGEQDKPFYRLAVSVPVVERRRSSPFERIVQVNEAGAIKLIDHLARDGFFDRSHSPGKLEKLPQPCYLLTVNAGDLNLTENMGWSLPMIHRLDALRNVLPSNGKKDMDLLLARLSGWRKKWQAEAIQNQQTSFKGWELYIWEEDGQNLFSLMAGTNRVKSDDQIAGTMVKGFDAIKTELDKLKKGEAVFLCGRRLQNAAPTKPAKAVIGYCQEIGLKAQ